MIAESCVTLYKIMNHLANAGCKFIASQP
jgi:hypothetical protein